MNRSTEHSNVTITELVKIKDNIPPYASSGMRVAFIILLGFENCAELTDESRDYIFMII